MEIVEDFVDNWEIAEAPKHQLMEIFTRSVGISEHEWEKAGEEADRTRFKIIVELLCYAHSSKSGKVPPSVLVEMNKLGGPWVRGVSLNQSYQLFCVPFANLTRTDLS